MEKVNDEQTFRALTSEEHITVAVFKTTWCKDCHYIDPFMPDVEKTYEGRIRFVHIDRDDLPDLCAELHILGIPSFIAFYKGSETIRFVSKLRKTREEIEQFLERVVQVTTALR